MFLDLAISAQDEALGLDSARDLAFIMARTYPEAKTLEVYDQKLASTGERGKAFLKKALSAYESQGSLGTQSKLRERVLAVEDSAEGRSTILLESIQGVSKEYASIAHAQRVLEVLASIHLIPDSKKGSLEAASERVCRIFSETYAGRVRTPEKIEKPILALTLKKIFREHLKAFPKSKKKALFYKNWLDVCELEKDALCLVRVSDEFLADSISAGAKTSSEANSATIAAKARAMDARLLGLELLQSGPDSAKYRKRFTDELSARLADPSASNGDLAGAKLAQLQIEEKNISGALSTLETVFKRAPSHEHWYRLKWAQLQNKDYQSVLHGPEVFGIQQIAGSPDPRLNAVMAEAALGMAEVARKSGDLDTMGKSIERFETVSSDQSKVQIARDEWIGAFVEKKSYIEALGQMQRFPDSWHQRAEADLWKKLVLVSLIEKGEHEQAEVLLKIWPETRRTALEPQLDLMVRLYFSGARAIEYQRVHSLGENQRLVWLSTAVVSQPGWTLNYFSRFPAKSGEEKSILRLAYKFLGKEDPLDPARLEHERMAKKTTFELAVAQVAIPSQSGKNKLSLQKYTQLLQKAISQVKLRREEMVPALKGQPAEVQLRIIESQRGLEGSIAKAILGSPVPGTLKGAELEQYRNGLQELAQEYQAQIQELEKASAKIEEQQKELRLALEKQEGEKTLPALKNSDGLIPDEYTGKDSLMRNVLSMARSGNSWGALIEIERLRTKKQIEGLDFWRMRSWILARSESPFLLRYLYDELQDAQANEVISKWKELAK
ncbi:hypothetical protein EBZ37_06965 [bacterium]|nr:hypothetical protein [bacterium]